MNRLMELSVISEPIEFGCCGADYKSPRTPILIEADEGSLLSYHLCVAGDEWPQNEAERKLLTKARAMDLATKSGHWMKENTTIQVSAVGGVPVAISLDRRPIIIRDEEYTPSEREVID